eukprot:ANDGO_05335.mRNA.1 hypothetical protein
MSASRGVPSSANVADEKRHRVPQPQSAIRFPYGNALPVVHPQKQSSANQPSPAAGGSRGLNATPGSHPQAQFQSHLHAAEDYSDPALRPFIPQPMAFHPSVPFSDVRVAFKNRILEHMRNSVVFRATWQARTGKPFSEQQLDFGFMDKFNAKGVEIDGEVPEIADSPLPALVFRFPIQASGIFDSGHVDAIRRSAARGDDVQSAPLKGDGSSNAAADMNGSNQAAKGCADSSGSVSGGSSVQDGDDVPTTDVLSVNAAFSQAFGWSSETLTCLGISAFSLFSLELYRSSVTRSIWEACLAFPDVSTFHPSVDFDAGIACTDGTFRWGNIRMICKRGRLGYPVVCVCYVRPPQLMLYPSKDGEGTKVASVS